MQVQSLLRLYTALLCPLRAAALQSRPSWAQGQSKIAQGCKLDQDNACIRGDHTEETAVVDNHLGPASAHSSSTKIAAPSGSEAASNVPNICRGLPDQGAAAECNIGKLDGIPVPWFITAASRGSSDRGDIMRGQSVKATAVPFTPSGIEEQEDVQCANQAECAAFAAWVNAEAKDEWDIVSWFVWWALPKLLATTRMLPPQAQNEGLR